MKLTQMLSVAIFSFCIVSLCHAGADGKANGLNITYMTGDGIKVSLAVPKTDLVFKNGFAKFKTQSSGGGDRSTGFTDEHGNGIEPKFHLAEDFTEGFAAVESFEETFGNKLDRIAPRKRYVMYFINSAGKNVFGKQYSKVFPFSEGLALVCSDLNVRVNESTPGGACFYIDNTGNRAFPGWFNENSNKYSEGFAFVAGNDRPGSGRYIINNRGEEIISPPKSGEIIDRVRHGRALFKVNGLYGYYDNAGRIVINPEYIWATPFIGDYALVATISSEREGGLNLHLINVNGEKEDKKYPVISAYYMDKSENPNVSFVNNKNFMEQCKGEMDTCGWRFRKWTAPGTGGGSNITWDFAVNIAGDVIFPGGTAKQKSGKRK